MIRHLSYVSCDRCHGWPTEPVAEGAKEARAVARREGYVRRDGQDLCPDCQRELVEATDA